MDLEHLRILIQHLLRNHKNLPILYTYYNTSNLNSFSYPRCLP